MRQGRTEITSEVDIGLQDLERATGDRIPEDFLGETVCRLIAAIGNDGTIFRIRRSHRLPGAQAESESLRLFFCERPVEARQTLIVRIGRKGTGEE